jgi:two-component system nitrogen regulation sensor histidine kinase NtrY
MVLQKLMQTKLEEYNLVGMQVFTALGEELYRGRHGSGEDRLTFLLFDDEIIQNVLNSKSSIEHKPEINPQENYMYNVELIYSTGKIKQRVGVAVLYMGLPEGLNKRILETQRQVRSYQAQFLTKHQIQDTFILVFGIVTLVILFSALWLGLNITRTLSAPIEHLANATRAVAAGNMDFRLSEDERRDEIGQLYKSFNQMTEDIWRKEDLIAKTNRELQDSNRQLEEKHLHLETILEEINSGVISLDEQGKIVKINRTASRILQIEPGRVVGEHYGKAFEVTHLSEFRDLIKNLIESNIENISRDIQFATNRQIVHASINMTRLLDTTGYGTGFLIFMEDLTQLTKAQKAAAWQEVARRIAHEIKNPLTPIQLSTQRLIKRYADTSLREDTFFDECTRTILQEVHGLQMLVNEFSRFARLPEANPKPSDLNLLVRDTLARYDGGVDGIQIKTVLDESLPLANIDSDQIKRVIINLVDNAMQAMDSGTIEVSTEYIPVLRMIKIEVSDNGPGIKPEDKERLFMPYFSTKGNGTGLGLAIVNRIISDHYGYIRVKDNEPQGTRFIIEIPLGMRASKGW